MLCQCPKLTALQSRLAASVSALALLALVYWSLSSPQFAYAAELAVDGSGQLRRSGEDHNWHRLPEGPILDGAEAGQAIVKRADGTAQISGNDAANPDDIAPGQLTLWKYPSTLLTSKHASPGVGLPSEPSYGDADLARHKELRRTDGQDSKHKIQARQNDRTIYISANTCQQPAWNGSGTQNVAPPQLTLYVSTTAGKHEIGPNGGSEQTTHPFDNGFVNASRPASSGDWYIAVSAPELPKNFTGSWGYQIAVSIDGYFHAAEEEDAFLYLLDTDVDSALLVTGNLTTKGPTDEVSQQWLALQPPFVLFAANSNLTSLLGVENSFCGLQTFVNDHSQIQASQNDIAGSSSHVEMSMISRGLGSTPKEQFYIRQLNATSQYRAFLAMDGNSTAAGSGVVGGGGKVWSKGVSFTTKTDGNCQLMFDLDFCDEVAYAVPSNPSNPRFTSLSALRQFYDNYTQTWYTPFNYTLAQIPCETTSDARYSLAKTCTDCASAYKEWLCAVSIPRCEDFSSAASYLQPRNVAQPFHNGSTLSPDFLLAPYNPMPGAPTLPGSSAFLQTYNSSFATNRSRNLWIDEEIMPGPYKEVLPCEDLCWGLMQSCPASMNFACPYPGRGLEASYGSKGSGGGLRCSYLGAVYLTSDAATAALGLVVWRSLACAAAVVGMLAWI